MIRKIIKNSLYILTAQVLGKIISFVYAIYLARNLGVDNFGFFITALSYFTIATSIGDLGITRYLIREISIHRPNLSKLISTAIFLRIFTISVFFLLFVVVSYIFDPLILRRNLAILAIAAVIPQSIAITLDAIFVSSLKLSYSSLGLLFLNLTTSCIGILLISLGYGVYGPVISLMIGQIVYVLILLSMIFFNKIKWLDVINVPELINLVKGSYLYGILNIIGLLSFRIDILLLSYFKGSYETGIYGAAYKFFEAAFFIPSALAVVFFPMLARSHEEDINRIKNLYFKSLKLMLLLGVIITVVYLLVLPYIINYLLPNYTQAISVIQLLSLAIPFIFVHIPSSQVILSSEKYLMSALKMYLVLFTINIILYGILIPRYGIYGASVATIVSEILTFSLFILYIKKVIFHTTT